ncbi:MAG: hypothetical protein KJN62_06075 [Deltaproteobacteria bacterium]|nr:hypothetical protein [Deltaproteobacteria bacterium]
MEKKFLMLLSLLMCLLVPITTAYSYGGGGGGGGAGSDSEISSSGGGAVSWSSNPNGLDVIGSSIWHGRPENIKKGPYQPDTAVEDAEQDLLDGLKRGEYTADEVKTNLEWAQKVGITISDEAKKTLSSINNPPKTPAKQTAPSQSGQFTEKEQNKIVKGLDIVNQYYKLKDKRKQQGKKMTTGDLYSIGAKTAIKGKVSPKVKKYVDKAFDLLGY